MLVRLRLSWNLSLIFFFQAEDGIRDDLVTGVQTCALPIYLVIGAVLVHGARAPHVVTREQLRLMRTHAVLRSEERRVGKECRYRWAPDHEKKNKNKKCWQLRKQQEHTDQEVLVRLCSITQA